MVNSHFIDVLLTFICQVAAATTPPGTSPHDTSAVGSRKLLGVHAQPGHTVSPARAEGVCSPWFSLQAFKPGALRTLLLAPHKASGFFSYSEVVA